MSLRRSVGLAGATAALLVPVLAGCGTSTASTPPSGSGAAPSSTPSVTYGAGSAGPIGITDGWVSDAGMSGMSGMSDSSGSSGSSGESGGLLAAYAVIHDRGAIGDRLVSVSSPIARHVELHTTIEEGTAATMRRVSGLDLPGGGQISFAIGGSHVMIGGLDRVVRAGDRIPLVFTFRSGTVVHADFPVLDPEDRPGL